MRRSEAKNFKFETPPVAVQNKPGQWPGCHMRAQITPPTRLYPTAAETAQYYRGRSSRLP
jgi:hypothetical protein